MKLDDARQFLHRATDAVRAHGPRVIAAMDLADRVVTAADSVPAALQALRDRAPDVAVGLLTGRLTIVPAEAPARRVASEPPPRPAPDARAREAAEALLRVARG